MLLKFPLNNKLGINTLQCYLRFERIKEIKDGYYLMIFSLIDEKSQPIILNNHKTYLYYTYKGKMLVGNIYYDCDIEFTDYEQKTITGLELYMKCLQNRKCFAGAFNIVE